MNDDIFTMYIDPHSVLLDNYEGGLDKQAYRSRYAVDEGGSNSSDTVRNK